MKNKKALYLLLPAAIALWGYIIYKVVVESGSKPVASSTKMGAITKNSKTKLPETFALQLDYRDPFLGNKVKSTVEKPITINKSIPAKPKVEESKKNMVWPVIAYSGRIVNNRSHKAIHMLNIGGKEYIVTEGQTVEGLKVAKLTPNEVILLLGNEKKTFSK